MDEREVTRKMDAYDGVVYIPGGHRPPPDAGETRKIDAGSFREPAAVTPGPRIGRRPGGSLGADKPGGGGSAAKKAAKAPRTPIKKTNYAIILVTTVFVGVIAAVFVFATVLNSVLNDDGGANGPIAGGPGANNGVGPDGGAYLPPEVTIPPAPGSVSLTGLIRDIRTNRLDIYIFETGELRSFFVESHSNLRDRFGNLITFAQFDPGDVVEISHAIGSNTVEVAQLSAQVRFYRDIVGVNAEDGELIIGNRRYVLGSAPVVRYRGAAANITDLDPIDIVTVGIFQDRHVTAIDISRGHGEVFIPQNETIESGSIEVGTSVFTMLSEEAMTLRIPTGDNRLVIRGANIEPLIFDIYVNRGAVVPLNFDGLTYVTGSLIVRTEAPDAQLHIDDRWHPVNEAIYLDFGTHTLIVEAPGYMPFMQEVEIGPAPQEITVNLTAQVITRNVIISTNPNAVRVYIDEEFMGLTPLSIDLSLGRHEITLERTGWIGATTSIAVTDTSTIFSFMLTADPAWSGQD
jgi:hypothetical protein